MELISFESLIALLTLTGLELVLGIDNIVFIIVVTDRLPDKTQKKARNIGISTAMISRIALLIAISLIMRLSEPFMSLGGHPVSGRDLILFLGGLFLLWKATFEIHERIEGHGTRSKPEFKTSSLVNAVGQILLLDLVFSLDSVITAVGMARHIEIMIAAIVIAVILMLVFLGPLSRFVMAHPTIQMLAFSFLLLVGVFLVAEGLGKHIDRGYIYFAMAFSLGVEMLNMRVRKLAGP